MPPPRCSPRTSPPHIRFLRPSTLSAKEVCVTVDRQAARFQGRVHYHASRGGFTTFGLSPIRYLDGQQDGQQQGCRWPRCDERMLPTAKADQAHDHGAHSSSLRMTHTQGHHQRQQSPVAGSKRQNGPRAGSVLGDMESTLVGSTRCPFSQRIASDTITCTWVYRLLLGGSRGGISPPIGRVSGPRRGCTGRGMQ